MNHATGPWKIDGNIILSASGGTVAESIAGYQGMRDANSLLIAAAPDLLEALEGLLADKYLSDPINNSRMANARAAIAKARGES